MHETHRKVPPMIREPAAFEALLERVRRFVRDIAIPAEARVESCDEIPKDIVATMRADGFFGWSIPEAYGGAGLTTEELVLAAFELSQCSVAFRARVGTNTGIGSEGIVADGTEQQKQAYLPRLASGEWTGCLAVTEPDAGSEASNVRTTARRDGGCYILDGEKCFITNAPLADVFTVTARTDPHSKGAAGVSAFIVERGSAGLATGAPYRKMGLAGQRGLFQPVPGACGQSDRRPRRRRLQDHHEGVEQAARTSGRAVDGTRDPDARHGHPPYQQPRSVRRAGC